MDGIELKKMKRFESIRKPKPTIHFQNEIKLARRSSLKSVEDLIQCGICLDRFKDPRMLPCQHTFCLSCLETHLISRNLMSTMPSTEQIKLAFAAEVTDINCPMCQMEVGLSSGFDSLKHLPKNLYINSLLKLLEEEDSKTPTPILVADYKCVKCQTVSEREEHVCQHCLQIYCSVCWEDHIKELDDNLAMLINQVSDSEIRLKHKVENFTTRCDRLHETITDTTRQRIKQIETMEKSVKNDVEMMKEQNKVIYEDISKRVQKLKCNILAGIEGSRNSKITTYMNMHRETAKLFDEIYRFGEARVIFDPVKYRIDQDEEGIYNEEDDNECPKEIPTDSHLENLSAMVKHYRTRTFVPKLLWNKCPRPGGVGIAPWDSTKIYITATDSHNILILDREKFKLLGRINHPEMLCPTSLCFSDLSKEIFVSDKWKHCVHLFTEKGKYSRSFSKLNLKNPEGITMGPNHELVVCDTGNNRILVVNPVTGELISIIGKGELSLPSSIAVYGKNIIVADTGNHRIKIFNMEGKITTEFGSLGRHKGQFRSAEVVAVDCSGFIFVGDAGNARIQVFRPDGKLVKIIGSKIGFSWISGIYITPELDVITTDSRSRCLRIF